MSKILNTGPESSPLANEQMATTVAKLIRAIVGFVSLSRQTATQGVD
jgi:hypothetical protein